MLFKHAYVHVGHAKLLQFANNLATSSGVLGLTTAIMVIKMRENNLCTLNLITNIIMKVKHGKGDE